jgi:hypothetical protein
MKRSLLLGLLALALTVPPPAFAQDGSWNALPLGQFVVVYQKPFELDALTFTAQFEPDVNDAYSELSALYATELDPPITIRLYPDADTFQQLNALVPNLGEGVYHAHSGAREIALVAPFPPDLFNTEAIVNVIRHELNGLFLYQLSDGRLPGGLEVGVNQYVERPGAHTEASLDKIEAAYVNGQLLGWADVADGPWVYVDHEVAYPQSLSIAAFLIDSYGYAKLIDFVRAIPDAGGYRAALAQVYGRPLDRLEQDWLAYLPDYLGARWQSNVLFNYDLQPFAEALEQRAYTQVMRGLEVVIPFLEATGQLDKARDASVLQSAAVQGVAAGEMVKAMRDALLTGAYTDTLDLGELARATYLPLYDETRLAEISDYELRAQEILELRARLDSAEAQAAAGQLDQAEARLLKAGTRLQALGDSAGALRAQQLLDAIRAQRAGAARWAIIVAAAIVLAVLAHQAYLFRQRRRKRAVVVL